MRVVAAIPPVDTASRRAAADRAGGGGHVRYDYGSGPACGRSAWCTAATRLPPPGDVHAQTEVQGQVRRHLDPPTPITTTKVPDASSVAPVRLHHQQISTHAGPGGFVQVTASGPGQPAWNSVPTSGQPGGRSDNLRHADAVDD